MGNREPPASCLSPLHRRRIPQPVRERWDTSCGHRVRRQPKGNLTPGRMLTNEGVSPVHRLGRESEEFETDKKEVRDD